MAPSYRAYRDGNRCYSRLVVGRQEVLGFQGGHATRASRGDRLAPALVLAISGGEHALDVGLGRARDRLDISLIVGLDLTTKERGVRNVSDCEEQAGRADRLALV